MEGILREGPRTRREDGWIARNGDDEGEEVGVVVGHRRGNLPEGWDVAMQPATVANLKFT